MSLQRDCHEIQLLAGAFTAHALTPLWKYRESKKRHNISVYMLLHIISGIFILNMTIANLLQSVTVKEF